MSLSKFTVLEDFLATYNHAKLIETHTAYEFLPIILDVAALEYIEGHAVPFLEKNITARRIALEVDLKAVPKHSWRVWLEDCDPDSLRPEIMWPLDEAFDPGPVCTAMTAQITRAVETIREREPYLSTGEIHMSATLSGVGSHKKLSLIERRAALLAAAGETSTPQETLS